MNIPDIAGSVTARILDAAKTIKGIDFTPPKAQLPQMPQFVMPPMPDNKELSATLAQLNQTLGAEKELVKDAEGNVVGIRPKLPGLAESGLDTGTILHGGNAFDALLK